jgi:ATP-dependent DNA helicase RecG
MNRYTDDELVSLPWDLHPIAHAQLSDLSRAFFEDEYLPKAFAPDVF